jgi:hypothetical protein
MHRKKISLLAVIFGSILFFSQCLNSKESEDPRGSLYAGSAACMSCHQNIYSSYLHTAHYFSTSPASFDNIQGSFSKDSNSFIFNDSMKIVMENRKGIPFQVLYVNDKEINAQRFDIVFGHIKGESYLYWKNDSLFQLPVSYFNALHIWSASPGYDVNKVDFNRLIERRCFECHSSYIKESFSPSSSLSMQNVSVLDKNSLIYNIDCERCHGPAAAHVQFQTEYPEDKEAKYIVSYKSLSRNQKIDMCAVCHSGNRNIMLRSTFAFKPGDTLAGFMLPPFLTNKLAHVDVHGNQCQLLAQSKCFINSNMDCSTCHNTHVNDRGNSSVYNQRCITCHSTANNNFCKMAGTTNISFLENNCTSCHMPAQPSNAIVVQASKNKMNIPVFVVNHQIAVYPEESKKVMTYFKKDNR